MPFGKHKGRPVSEVTADYLEWCLHEFAGLRPWLRAIIEEELERREDDWYAQQGRARPNGCNPGGLAAVRPLVQRWYREMALRFHPDPGGDTVAMQTINAAHERLLELSEPHNDPNPASHCGMLGAAWIV
jgi:hypothetical protein